MGIALWPIVLVLSFFLGGLRSGERELVTSFAQDMSVVVFSSMSPGEHVGIEEVSALDFQE